MQARRHTRSWTRQPTACSRTLKLMFQGCPKSRRFPSAGSWLRLSKAGLQLMTMATITGRHLTLPSPAHPTSRSQLTRTRQTPISSPHLKPSLLPPALFSLPLLVLFPPPPTRPPKQLLLLHHHHLLLLPPPILLHQHPRLLSTRPLVKSSTRSSKQATYPPSVPSRASSRSPPSVSSSSGLHSCPSL